MKLKRKLLIERDGFSFQAAFGLTSSFCFLLFKPCVMQKKEWTLGPMDHERIKPQSATERPLLQRSGDTRKVPSGTSLVTGPADPLPQRN